MVNKNIVDTTLEQAREWGNALYLSDGLVLTDKIAHASISKEPIRLNFILMALCRKGKATYNIDTCEQTVLPGDLFFISERHIVDNFQSSDDFDSLYIMLSTQFYHGFVQNVKNVSSLLLFSMNNPVVHLTTEEIQTFDNYFQTIRKKMTNKNHHYRTELVQALLLAMFYDMSDIIYRVEQNSAKKQTRSDVIFSRFINLLQENFRKERRVGWYASQLEITAKYLSEVVKNVSKRTPNEWIDSYVVLEIRVLLKNSPKTIKEITEELNFPNQSFLGKYFKEHVGVSPSEYRKD